MLNAILAVALAVSSFASAVALDQPAPRFGDAVTFTIAYPQEAAKQAHNTQQHDNPQVQVDCYQAGVPVMRENAIVASKTKTTGGWISVTTPVTLSANGGNGLLWTSGGASCGATLYSYYNGVTVWASTQFEVLP